MATQSNATYNLSTPQRINIAETAGLIALNAASSPFGVAPNNYIRLKSNTYDTTPWWSAGIIPASMIDFRSAGAKLSAGIKQSILTTTRLDGTAAALNGSKRAVLYAALSATVGPYIVFGRSAVGAKGKGWGDHGSVTAPKLDFTARSNVNTKWDSQNGWVATNKTIERLTPFRGDKVNVIDFRKTTIPDAYRWKPKTTSKILGALVDKAGLTSDFIKFYFTGPSIVAGDDNSIDDIIVFRASITTLQESYTAGWTPVQMIGRADPNYHYSSYGRELSLDFSVYATDRDEMKPIYRKLNAIAGYMAPSYSTKTIGLTGPWLRMTIGDLFVQQPVIITSLTYNLTDSDTTWEMNIEDDPEMMQAPHRISVSMGLTVIADWIPEKGGRFYTLAKNFDDNGIPIKGNDNWLSDAYSTTEQQQIQQTLKIRAEAEAARELYERSLVTTQAGISA
jgi:hypothetical protein